MSALSIFDAAAATPDREALVCDGHRLTFAELARRVHARSAQLGLHHAHAEPIALLVDHSLAMFECLYALFAAGIPMLPVHPRLTERERQILLDASGARVFVDPATLPRIVSAPTEAFCAPIIAAEHALVLVPSSGSTGAPKLVELSRRAFQALAAADAQRVPAEPGDRALLCLPLSHVGGLSLVIRALAARRCCVVFRASGSGLLGSIPELAQALIDERVSLLSLVPPVLSRLLRHEPRIAELAPLRAVLLGGQACPAALFDEARARGVPVLTSYGLTEMCSQVTTQRFPPPRHTPLERGVVGAGFPLPGVELRVVNGLVQVRGPTLFTGYVGKPSALDASGFFATGDRGEFDAELGLFVFGRASELIISGGENIDPTEVEHALMACAGIEAACVFGVPDPEFGERVAAALELSAGFALDEPALFGELDRGLASFKQPRLVCYFEPLPRLGSGKLDRPRVRTEAEPHLRPAERAERSHEALVRL